MPEYNDELRAEVDAAMAKALKTRDACRYYSMSSFKDTPEADDVLNLAMWAVPLLTAHIDAQAAEIARLREALEWYAYQMCEHSTCFEGCGKLTADACAGCPARAALTSTGAA